LSLGEDNEEGEQEVSNLGVPNFASDSFKTNNADVTRKSLGAAQSNSIRVSNTINEEDDIAQEL
jgi:hypothetical protein